MVKQCLHVALLLSFACNIYSMEEDPAPNETPSSSTLLEKALALGKSIEELTKSTQLLKKAEQGLQQQPLGRLGSLLGLQASPTPQQIQLKKQKDMLNAKANVYDREMKHLQVALAIQKEQLNERTQRMQEQKAQLARLEHLERRMTQWFTATYPDKGTPDDGQ